MAKTYQKLTHNDVILELVYTKISKYKFIGL